MRCGFRLRTWASCMLIKDLVHRDKANTALSITKANLACRMLSLTKIIHVGLFLLPVLPLCWRRLWMKEWSLAWGECGGRGVSAEIWDLVDLAREPRDQLSQAGWLIVWVSHKLWAATSLNISTFWSWQILYWVQLETFRILQYTKI